MSPLSFGSLSLDITGNTAGLTRDITNGVGSAFKKLAGVAAAAGLGLGFKSLIDGARESAKVMRLTEQVIKSTGGIAGITAKQVSELATSISNLTGADDEAIQSGANLLATFTQVRNGVGKGNDIFNQATTAAVDLAAAMNGGEVSAAGIKSASLQLGKALNDPAKGLTALTRSGVSFTAQQKEQVKSLVASGKTMEAQKIILSEMQTQFGGAAAAAADPLTRLTTIAGNLGEDIGALLLPAVNSFAGFMTTTVVPAVSAFLPKLQEIGGEIRDRVAPVVAQLGATLMAAGPGFMALGEAVWTATAPLRDFAAMVLPLVTSGIQNVISGIASVGTFLSENEGAVVALTAALTGLVAGFVAFKAVTLAQAAASAIAAVATGGWTAAFWALNAALYANPVGLVIAAVVALGVAFSVAWSKSETFREITVGVFNTVKDAIVTAMSIAFQAFTWWIKGILNGISGLAGAWSKLPSILGGGDDGWASKVQAAANGIIDGINSVQSSINSLKGKDIRLGINVVVNRVEQFNETPGAMGAGIFGGGTGGSIATTKKGTSAMEEFYKDEAKNTFIALDKEIGKIGQNVTGGSFGGGTGGGGGGGGADKAGKDAAKAAKDAAKKAAAAAAAAALKTSKKQITASKFIDSITGSKEGIDTALDKLYDSLKAANKDKAAALVKELNKDLTKLAGKRDAVSIKLDNAKKALSDIKKESKDYSASIKQAILDTGNVANNNTITFTGVRNSMRAAVRQAVAFKDAVAALTKAELNKNNLSQIIDAGPEAGLAAAKAIQQGGKAGIAELNDLNTQLTDAGTSMGSTTADTFYKAGVSAAQGLVNGLQSQEAALQKQMDKLALGMVKALKKELKIKSPSQVFEGLGQYVGQGLARGVNASRGGVSDAGRRLGASVVFGAGSVLVNGVSDPNAARTSGMLVGGAAADSIARSRELAALAGTG